MKKILPLLVFALLAGPLAADEMQEKHLKQGQIGGQTFKCEVVDVACYVAKGLKGEGHQACAAKCIGEGGELALLYDGNMYIPVDTKFHSLRKMFVTKGGEMVAVQGKRVEKSGLRYILIDSPSKK